MPFIEVFTREKLSDEIRAKLAEELGNTAMTIELGGPTESAKLVDWTWFHTMPADSWAVGGRFNDTYVKGRKMAFARVITPQGLLTPELKSRLVKEVARVLKAALGIDGEEADTGIIVNLIEIDDGQFGVGATIPTLFQLLDILRSVKTMQNETRYVCFEQKGVQNIRTFAAAASVLRNPNGNINPASSNARDTVCSTNAKTRRRKSCLHSM